MTNYSQSMRDALELVYTRNQEKIAELNEKMSSAQIAKLKKAYEPMRNKKISTSNADKLSKLMDKVGKDKEVLIQIVKADIPFVSQSAVTKLITKHNMKGAEINKFKEEFNIESVELDEGRMKELHGYIAKGMSAAEIAKKMKLDVKTIKALMDEVDLDEAVLKGRDYEYDEKKGVVKISKKNFAKVRKDAKGTDKSKPTMMVLTKKGTSLVPVQFEEVEEAYEYGTTEYANHTKEVTPGQEVDEASARADAKRSMRRDPSMRKQSPFSKDVSATDDDVKAASKNIIMQMRKAVSLRGKFPVQFADKKKIKIPADIAQAVQQKYNSFKKPADKEKFQAKVGKSYKDMLRALREEVQEEKTILDRIEEIIKENKNG